MSEPWKTLPVQIVTLLNLAFDPAKAGNVAPVSRPQDKDSPRSDIGDLDGWLQRSDEAKHRIDPLTIRCPKLEVSHEIDGHSQLVGRRDAQRYLIPVKLLQETQIDDCRTVKEVQLALSKADIKVEQSESHQVYYLQLRKQILQLRDEYSQCNDLLVSTINTFKLKLQQLKDLSEAARVQWIKCSEALVGSGLEHKEWWRNLDRWSQMLDAFDNSYQACANVAEAIKALTSSFQAPVAGSDEQGKLPKVLEKASPLCLDMYATLAMSRPKFIASRQEDLRRIAADLQAWLASFQAIRISQQFTVQSRCFSGSKLHIQQGEKGIQVDTRWGKKNSIPPLGSSDCAIGIASLEMFGESMSISLGDGGLYWQPHLEHRCVSPNTRSSYVAMPARHSHDCFQFGTSCLDLRPDEPVITPASPNANYDREATYFDRKYSWSIAFPKAFSSDSVTVQPWIMDTHVAWDLSQIERGPGIVLEIQSMDRNGFRITANIANLKAVHFLRIGYAAYNGQNRCCAWSQQQCEFTNLIGAQAKVIPYPNSPFQRRPVVAPMLRSFKLASACTFNLDVRFAASRDGLIIKATAAPGTVLSSVVLEVISLESEVASFS